MLLAFLAAMPNDPDNDVRLMSRARRGDQQAIIQIYETYFDPIYQFIRWRVNDLAVVEDLTSEVFIEFLNALNSQQAPRQSLRGWLFRVTRNILYDHYNHAVITDELDDQWPNPDAADLEARLHHTMEIDRVRQSLQQLAPDQQEVLVLRFDQMLSLRDTAEIMGKSLNAIKSLQFRGINALRRVLEQTPSGVDRDPS
jgi:RNA polymerase sigma-70 factor, ECF subfamily